MNRDSGVGLANVHSRIILKFGEPYGISIISTEGQGTETVIVIPVLKGDEVTHE
jgi:two-component system sensor histidine kinase YesM